MANQCLKRLEMNGKQDICAILHAPGEFASRSGMLPLAEALGARTLFYDFTWERLQKRSWTLGHNLRRFGNAYYGSEWNALVPFRDERRLAREFSKHPAKVTHFMWGEFASPRNSTPFRSPGGLVVGTFHCSARRQQNVISPRFRLDVFDLITLMSKTQEPFFLERGVPADRITTILHGVDSTYFTPANRTPREDPLRLLLVGSTERDHEFAAMVTQKLPSNIATLRVCTTSTQHAHYKGVRNVEVLPFLSEAAFLEEYQLADVLFMPMLDCTANNAILESMACGTPVMVNRVGGIPEYVDSANNIVMDDKRADEWVERLIQLAHGRDELAAMRPAVRQWAESFDWAHIATRYQRCFAHFISA